MAELRPDPEKILQRVQEEERRVRRGKLKIYLGAAPGVGKTYEMLRDAFVERNKGLDVVIGVAESHGRDEISRMIKDFELLPLQKVPYHGKELSEFDIDGALKRNPGLILIDEMAHSNAPGLRHPKRWQDIKELLDRGINVYTTLNVQHIESLNDDVTQIIQAPIKETVPDFMIELADSMELVDIPPEELLKRLSEGKIYIAEQADLAIEHFFRIGNLIALRALALRITAERVGAEVRSYRHNQNITNIWHTKEKILVCVGPGVESLKLIRAARRMAVSLQTEWVAIYVETPRLKSSEDLRNKAIQNLRFAQQMGAETRFLSGVDIVKEIMTFSREQNVTLIMIWKYIRTRQRDLFFRNLANEIVRYSGEINVYIVTGKREDHKLIKQNETTKAPIAWSLYAIAAGSAVFATVINYLLYSYLSAANLIMVYLLSIIMVSLFGQQGPSFITSVLSILGFNMFIIPHYNFSISDVEYIFTFVVMLLVGQIISHLTKNSRRQAEAALFSEQHTSALYKLTRQLASTRGVDKLLEIGERFISEQFLMQCLIIIAENSQLVFKEDLKKNTLNAKEQSIAQWVYDLGQVAGLGTETLPFAEALYLPLTGTQGSLGVLRVCPKSPKHLFTPEQMHLLEACCHQISLALEADKTTESKGKTVLMREKNFISQVLLQSIAHELRSPLAAIMVAANNQIELAPQLSLANIKKSGQLIYFEAGQLNRLINNFLKITYLESKGVTLQKKSHSLLDTIQSVLESLDLKFRKKRIKVQIPEDLPMCLYDNGLIQDVFINLIDNAIKLTPSMSPILIAAQIKDEILTVSIEDQGPGIMPDEVNKLFEKFYRGRMVTTEHGLGLGLAICHRIIKAHGGKIWAENRQEGGAVFYFTLPKI